MVDQPSDVGRAAEEPEPARPGRRRPSTTAGTLALACHHTPDGDALGSMLAIHHLASAAGKTVVSSWPEPFVVAPHYSFLPGLELATKPADFPAAPEVMVTLDCGSLGPAGRAGPARPRPPGS